MIVYGSSAGGELTGPRAAPAPDPEVGRAVDDSADVDGLMLAIEVEAAKAARAAIFTAAGAARKVAAAGREARAERAHEAALAAQTVAGEAARGAAVLQMRVDTAALRVALAATQAADILSAANLAGNEAEAARRARRVAALVEASARTKAQEAMFASETRARDVKQAADQIARVVAGADQALEAKVRAAADALLIEARTTAQRLAAQTRARAAQPVPDPGQHSRSAAGLPDVGKQREPAQDS